MPTTHAEQGDDDANHKRNLAHSLRLDLAARPKSKRALVKTNQSWFTKLCACRAPQVHEPCENQT